MKTKQKARILEPYRNTFFMLGLVFSLAGSYYALSYETVYEKFVFSENENGFSLLDEDPVERTFQRKPMPEKVIETKSKAIVADVFTAIPDQMKIPDELFGLDYDSDTLEAVWSSDEPSDDPLPIHIVEKWPVFKGCDNFVLESDRQDCFEEKLIKYVRDNFKTQQNIWGVSESIMVHFKIDKTGEVTEVRATRGDELNRKEAERIIRNLPDFLPAMYQGKKVATTYSLPISIN